MSKPSAGRFTQPTLRFGFLATSAQATPRYSIGAATPWWISSFVPNFEAEFGLALTFASIPTLPWPRLFPFAALLVFACVTFAWWGFLGWLILDVI